MPATLADVPTLPTVDVPGVAVIWPGVHNGRNYTLSELGEMVKAFHALEPSGALRPPVKLGHADDERILQSDGLPAAGWIKNLYLKGRTLYADLAAVPGKVAQLIKAGGYRTRSLEIYLDQEFGGQQWPVAVKALSLLGEDIPAVESLDDIVALYTSDGRQFVAAVTRMARGSDARMAGKRTRRNLADDGSDAGSGSGSDLAGASADDIQSAVEDALAQQYPAAEPDSDGQGVDGPSQNVLDWFLHSDPMSVIVSDQDVDNLFQIPFTYDPSTDTAQLQSPIPVKGTYTPNQSGQESGAGDTSDGGSDGTDGGSADGSDGSDASAPPEQAAAAAMARWPRDATHALARSLVQGHVAHLASGDPQDGLNKAIAALDRLLENTESVVSGGRGAPDWRAAVRMAKRALSAVKLRGGGRDQPGDANGKGATPAKPKPAAQNSRQEAETMTDNDIRQLLGLAPDADVKAALVRYKAGSVSLSDHREVVQRLETMERREAEREADLLVEAALREGKLRPTNRDWAKALCLSDRKSFESYVETTPAHSMVDLREFGRDGDVRREEVAATPILQKLSREAGIPVERMNEQRSLGERRAALLAKQTATPAARTPQLHKFIGN